MDSILCFSSIRDLLRFIGTDILQLDTFPNNHLFVILVDRNMEMVCFISFTSIFWFILILNETLTVLCWVFTFLGRHVVT